MHESWRASLYPLGFVATLLFSLRFVFQWIASEKKHKSHVPKIFWQISLAANLCMCIHTFIQVQYPFCVIQAINAVIAWRNLNFSQHQSKRKSFFYTLSVLLIFVAFISFCFAIEGLWLYGKIDWVRTPYTPWQSTPSVPLDFNWHLFGFLGGSIFAMRFWIQWIEVEIKGSSYLSYSFWVWSLIGAILALIYFIKLHDWVNILGYGIGIIPYIRNLVLINKFGINR
jgi:lipid-A-disaccharide synthase-like uncharacterized protein